MPLSRWLGRPGRSAPAILVGTSPAAEVPTRPTRRSVLGQSLTGAALAAWAWACRPVVGAGTPLPRIGRPGPPAKKPDLAWLSAKGFCSFPLDWPKDEMPRTGGQLAAALVAGWRGLFTFDNPDKVVDIAGGRYPAVDSLTIDLTGAVANPDRKPGKIPDPVPTSRSLAVRHFTLFAAPLISQKARINLKVTGTDVRFDLQRDKGDKDGRAMLTLADAKAGTLHFDVTLNDLERLMLASAKRGGGIQAVSVRAIDLDLESLSERSLVADLHVSTLVGLVPAGIRFTARVDIDERMDARVSHLTCDGDEVLGPLIVGFIRPGMARYEGKSRPLLSFPAGNLKLRDVQVRAGDRVALTAVFGA